MASQSQKHLQNPNLLVALENAGVNAVAKLNRDSGRQTLAKRKVWERMFKKLSNKTALFLSNRNL